MKVGKYLLKTGRANAVKHLRYINNLYKRYIGVKKKTPNYLNCTVTSNLRLKILPRETTGGKGQDSPKKVMPRCSEMFALKFKLI